MQQNKTDGEVYRIQTDILYFEISHRKSKIFTLPSEMSKFIVQETKKRIRTHRLKRIDSKICILSFDVELETIDFTNMRVFVFVRVFVHKYTQFLLNRFCLYTIPMIGKKMR